MAQEDERQPPIPGTTGDMQVAFTDPAAFREFQLQSDNKPLIREYLNKALQEKHAHVWETLTSADNSNALFIGAGNGGTVEVNPQTQEKTIRGVEIPLVQNIVQARTAIRGVAVGFTVYCVDPSPAMRAEFLSNARVAGIDEDVIDEHNYAATEFQNLDYHPPSSQLVASIHAHYYVPNTQEMAQKFVQAIAPNGVGVIILLSNQHDYYSTRDKHVGPIHRTEWREPHAEELLELFEGLGVKVESKLIESHLDISHCFDESGNFNPDERGQLLLEFIVREKWKNVPDQEKTEIAKEITQIARKNDKRDGRQWLILRDRAIWLSREEETPVAA